MRDKCCCPTFIVAAYGPYLAVLGAVITDRYIVQRLTGLEWIGMGHTFEDKNLYRVAQIFSSIHKALRELEDFYDELEKQDLKLVKGEPHPRFFPYHTTFTDYESKAIEEFGYLRPLASSIGSPFLVKLKSSGGVAVVKFVHRYGVEACQLLAEAGMAPRLIYYGSTDGQDDVRNAPKDGAEDTFGLHLGPFRMVAMEYIEGTNVHAFEADGRPKDIHTQVKEMVDKLHESDYVFGDLRPPNVMYSNGKAFLIDFNWCQGCWACLLFRVQRSSVGGEGGVVVLNKLPVI